MWKRIATTIGLIILIAILAFDTAVSANIAVEKYRMNRMRQAFAARRKAGEKGLLINKKTLPKASNCSGCADKSKTAK